MNALKRKGYSIPMATTKAGQKAVNKYVKNNYDRINSDTGDDVEL